MMIKVNASRVQALMFEKNIVGVYALARATNINASTTAKALKGEKVQLRTIAKLAKFFGVNGEELILKEVD